MHSLRLPLLPSSVIVLLSSLLSSAFAATPIDLGTAARFTVLGGSGITVGAGVRLFGDVAVTPGVSATLVGFGETRAALTLIPLAFPDHSTSPVVSGMLFAPDYTLFPSTLNQASKDSIAAYRSGAFQSPPDFTTGGDLGGRTLTAGIYTFSAAVTWSTDITLSGSCSDVFVFQVGGALGCAAGAKIILSGGVQAKNVFWVVNGAITTGAGAVLHGIFLTNAAATIAAGNTLHGRLLAQAAITIAATQVSVNVYPPTSTTCSVVPAAAVAVSSILSPGTSALSSSAKPAITVSTTLISTTTEQFPASTLTIIQPTTATATLEAGVCTTIVETVEGFRTTVVSLVTETATATLPAETSTISFTATLPATTETLEGVRTTIIETVDGVRTTVISPVTETTLVQLPGSTVTETVVVKETLPITKWATATTTTLVPVTQTVTSITTKFSTAQYAAAGRYPAAAATVSTETVVRAVSTLVIPTTIVWRQNVIQKVTSTIVWHVFDITTVYVARATPTSSSSSESVVTTAPLAKRSGGSTRSRRGGFKKFEH